MCTKEIEAWKEKKAILITKKEHRIIFVGQKVKWIDKNKQYV